MHQLLIACRTLRFGNPLQIGIQIQVLLHAQVFIQTEALRHITDRRLNLERLFDNVDIQCVDASLIGPQQPGRQPHERGLAGTIGSDETGHFAHLNADVDRL